MFYSKIIVRSVNTTIPLGDETINSSPVERGRSLMDPQPHPVLHFPFRMIPTSTNVFLQVAKVVEVSRGKIWAVQRMLKCFPVKFLKLIPHHIGIMETGVFMKKDDSVRQHSGAFWLFGASQHTQLPRNEPHLSAFLCLPTFPLLDVHTLHYAHLQSEKETTVWTCASSLCMSPVLHMAVSKCNNSVASFCEECVFMVGVRFSFDCPSYSRLSFSKSCNTSRKNVRWF